MSTVILAVLLNASNFVGASPVGFAGFLRLNVGSYEVFYERVVAEHHGLRLGLDFIHVHHSTEYIQSHQWTFGGSLTYRYYLREGYGVYFGLRLGYRRGFGRYGEAGDHDHSALMNQQWSAIPQAGYRFMLTPRIALGAHLGVGYGPYQVWATSDGHMTQENVRFSRDLLGVLPIVLDTELSIAVAF